MIRALRAALFAAIVRSDRSDRTGCAGRADSSDHNVREPVTALWAILSAPVFPRPACAAVVALEVWAAWAFVSPVQRKSVKYPSGSSNRVFCAP